MARVDEHPDERDREPLTLLNTIDCEECGAFFDVVYVCPDGVFDTEDLIEAPVMDVTCPGCQHTWSREYEGWVTHGDAG